MKTVASVETISKLPLVIDDLPGEAVPYALAAGEGRRTILGGMLITEITRPADSGGAFAAAWISGPRGSSVPATRAEEHLFVHLLDGVVDVALDGARHRLSAGDSLRVRPGSAFGWELLAHTNRFLAYSTRGVRQGLLVAAGTLTSARVHRSEAEAIPAAVWREACAISGADLATVPAGRRAPEVVDVTDTALNGHRAIVRAADGERWASHAQVNSYLARGRDTDASYFAVHTRGTRSPWIPRHRHHQHTENFLCLDGRVRLEANGTQLLLTRGDFLHAPAGTIHSFRFEGADTQMLGLLTTDVFEPFFEYMNTPTTERTFDDSGEPWFPADGFARARAELDVEVMGPPPQS